MRRSLESWERYRKQQICYGKNIAPSVFIFYSFVGTISAADIYVPDDYAKIQWAVDNASVSSTIIVMYL